MYTRLNPILVMGISNAKPPPKTKTKKYKIEEVSLHREGSFKSWKFGWTRDGERLLARSGLVPAPSTSGIPLPWHPTGNRPRPAAPHPDTSTTRLSGHPTLTTKEASPGRLCSTRKGSGTGDQPGPRSVACLGQAQHHRLQAAATMIPATEEIGGCGPAR